MPPARRRPLPAYKPRRQPSDPIDQERAHRFIESLEAGSSVREAAAVVEVPSRTLYAWRQLDAGFRKAWEDAMSGAGAQLILSTLMERALYGWQEPVFYQGEVVGHITKFDNTLLVMLAKARFPEMFKDQRSVQVTVSHLTGADLAASRELGARPELMEALVTLAERFVEYEAATAEQKALPVST